MIFGHAEKGVVSQEYLEAINRTVVITTSIPWLPTDTPTIRVKVKRGNGASDVTAGVRRLSNVFSLTASNTFKALEEKFAYAKGKKRAAEQDKLNPTLTMLFEPAAVGEGERVVLCRHVEKNVWEPLPARQAGQVTCSTPLNAETAPGLYKHGQADRYCLFVLQPPPGMISLSLEP